MKSSRVLNMKLSCCLAAAFVCGWLTAPPASADTILTFGFADAALFGNEIATVHPTGTFDFDLDTGKVLPNFTIDPHRSNIAPAGIDLYTCGASCDWIPSVLAFNDSSETAFLFRATFAYQRFAFELALNQGPFNPHPLTSSNVYVGQKLLLDVDFSGEAYLLSIVTGFDNGEDGTVQQGADTFFVPGSALEIIAINGVTTTPLPAALPLFATGLAGLGFLARRRRKQAAS